MPENLTIEPFFRGPVPLEEGEKKPFLSHLEELRWRILRSCLWLVLGTAAALRFSGRILDWFIQPVGALVFLTPAEPFLVHLKVAFIAGTVLVSPLVLREVWGFFRPALFPQEKRGVLLLIPASTALFLAGCWFGWWWLLPVGLDFLLGFGTDRFVPMLTLNGYVGFAGWLLVGSGIFFQTPIVVLSLARMGIVRPVSLLRQWRIAVLGILVLAAVLTPTPDVATQLLLAVPMAFLYMLSIGLAFLVVRR
ncbi:MAG: twin-arginine translocase subunit TatC [Candidatus Omnitrophica bacterium]|nr:twin-arginine translocase subunit TatC [Candidatus Omnitrophota bacterium]